MIGDTALVQRKYMCLSRRKCSGCAYSGFMIVFAALEYCQVGEVMCARNCCRLSSAHIKNVRVCSDSVSPNYET